MYWGPLWYLCECEVELGDNVKITKKTVSLLVIQIKIYANQSKNIYY